MKSLFPILIFCLLAIQSHGQMSSRIIEQDSVQKDSTKKAFLLQFIGDGYFPTKYFNFDLKYLIKYNQYEGFRTGIGGTTNSNFSEAYRLNGYLAYGFRDQVVKYNIGGAFRISPKRNTWIKINYTDDLEETGSSAFITDQRIFQLFSPRMINIDLFHRHRSYKLDIEHQIFAKVIAQTEIAHRKIDPTYDYVYNIPNEKVFLNYDISSIKLSAQWSPFSKFEYIGGSLTQTREGFPNFTFQYTRAFPNVLGSDLSFFKFDFRTVERVFYGNGSSTEIVLLAGIADGDTPLQYLYHTFPNNVNRETVLKRFSVAGNNSFETMFFNEFFSDRFFTLQFKHRFKPIEVTPFFKPEFVLLTKYALGTMSDISRHQGITFDTLEKGYTESGLEINRLFYGFGLSFAYRYGAYHLPDFEDNIAFKFTFNLNL